MSFFNGPDQLWLERIVDNLDNYSIHSLLLAYPCLQKHAVLITDHRLPSFYFSGLGGVDRGVLQTCQTMDINFDNGMEQMSVRAGDFLPGVDIPYGKAEDKQHIKLIEAVLTVPMYNIVRQEQGMERPCPLQDIDVDHLSFISVIPPPSNGVFDVPTHSWMRACVELEHRIDQFTRAKWFVGGRPYFSSNPETSFTHATFNSIHREIMSRILGTNPEPEHGSFTWSLEALSKNGYLSTLTTLRVGRGPSSITLLSLVGVSAPSLFSINNSLEPPVKIISAYLLVLSPLIDIRTSLQRRGDIKAATSYPSQLTVIAFEINDCTRNVTICPIFVQNSTGDDVKHTNMYLSRHNTSLLSNNHGPLILRFNSSSYDRLIEVAKSSRMAFKCAFAVGRYFTSCYINHTELEMTPTSWWEDRIKLFSGRRFHRRTHVEAKRWDLSKQKSVDITERYNDRYRVYPYSIVYNPLVIFPNDPRTYYVPTRDIS